VVSTATGCRPRTAPSRTVTRVTSASRRSLLPTATAYAAPPVVPLV